MSSISVEKSFATAYSPPPPSRFYFIILNTSHMTHVAPLNIVFVREQTFEFKCSITAERICVYRMIFLFYSVSIYRLNKVIFQSIPEACANPNCTIESIFSSVN